MKLWRISNYADLTGTGGVKVAGRWHNKGIPVVYLAESPALAMLETLVHFELEASEIPDTFQLLEISFAETTTGEGQHYLQQLSPKALPSSWPQRPQLTRAIGDEWLSSQQSALLKVPSVLVPYSYNYLLNPRHPLAKHATIVRSLYHPYDDRLLPSAH